MRLTRRQLRRMILSETIAYTQDQKDKIGSGPQDLFTHGISIDDHMQNVADGYRYAHQKTNAQEIRSEMHRLIDYRKEAAYIGRTQGPEAEFAFNQAYDAHLQPVIDRLKNIYDQLTGRGSSIGFGGAGAPDSAYARMMGWNEPSHKMHHAWKTLNEGKMKKRLTRRQLRRMILNEIRGLN